MTRPSFEDLASVAQSFSEVPHTSIPSNEPYGVGSSNPEASSERCVAQRDFLAGEGAWPNISLYPLLDVPPLDASERRYSKQLHAIDRLTAEQDGETPEADMLYEQVARKLAETYRHMEIRRLIGHVAANEAEAAELSRTRAANMSGELFGEPEEGPFSDMLAADVRAAVGIRSSGDDKRAHIANEYIALIGLNDQEAKAVTLRPREKSYELRDETMEIIREDLFAIFPGLRQAMQPFKDTGVNTKPVNAKPAFEAALRGLGIHSWTVKVLENKKAAAEAKGRLRMITYGELRDDFTSETLYTRPVHEGLHALRYENAKAQKQPYRRNALPGSQAIEEGLPVVIEQILSGKKRVPGEKYYMQLGLLKGMHKAGMNAEQSYRAVHEIMWRRAVLYDKGKLSEVRLAEIKADTYSSVMRTARGNARDNRDIIYFLGACKATQFLNETARLPEAVRRERLRWAFSGIFDPTNADHARLFGGDPAAPYLVTAA